SCSAFLHPSRARSKNGLFIAFGTSANFSFSCAFDALGTASNATAAAASKRRFIGILPHSVSALPDCVTSLPCGRGCAQAEPQELERFRRTYPASRGSPRQAAGCCE